MELIKALGALIMAVPELLDLIKEVRKWHQEQATKKKVKDDLAQITRAFSSRNADDLRKLFNEAKDD